jgi:hypothetical protein
MARIAARTAHGLAQAQHFAPVIDSVALYAVHQGHELRLGPDAQPCDDLPFAGDLPLALVPLGQPCVAVICARLAVQADVQLPGSSRWIRLTGQPPWRVSFTADRPGGPLRTVVRNAAQARGVTAESFPLRVAPELSLRDLRFPGFTPKDIADLTAAIGNARPAEVSTPASAIEDSTRALLGVGLLDLAQLEAAVEAASVTRRRGAANAMPERFPPPVLPAPDFPELPDWPRLELPLPWPYTRRDGIV